MSEKRYRMQRVNEALREVLSIAIGRGLKDPRVGFVTVTGVEATNDLRQARVYVSILGDAAERELSLVGLRSGEGFLQGVINDELQLKRTPALEFVYDESVDRGFRISKLLIAETALLGEPIDEPQGVDAEPGGETPERPHPVGPNEDLPPQTEES
ncbi:MAG TPA: 30S ribosome-binding factor RbfA [Thermoleophilia bacterium]|nr:30S ribosome-binding factor RbfA [Thermoleophilia bacterium]